MLVGISPDSVESHQRFKEANRLAFPLGADSQREIINLYGVRRALVGLTKRVTYLIDKAGVIRNVFHHELTIGRHQDDVLKGLRRLNASSQRS